MGKKIKSREAQLRAAESEIAARLRARSETKAGPAFIGRYADFAPIFRDKIEAYRRSALRAPEDWRCRLRSRSPERRFLELVRFTFARYRVARHLENAWIEETHAFADRLRAPAGVNREGDEGEAYRGWYILVAQGGSFYKSVTHDFMSKLETHHFLNAPEDLSTTPRAFCYALARAQTRDMSVALRVARSRLSAFPFVYPFWRDVARYFARNPVSIPEMNDLIDFLQAAYEEDRDLSLTGRSLDGLRRRMTEWHRTLRRREIVCGGAWDGHPLPDVDYEAGSEDRRAIWRFRQIKTGNDLFKEGQRMHHCVVSYKFRCLSGDLSIWSLTCEYPIGKLNRGVTLELRSDGGIAQCRGFANRLPYANEVTVVKRWAAEHGLTWKAIER
jgi:hypothetical protein